MALITIDPGKDCLAVGAWADGLQALALSRVKVNPGMTGSDNLAQHAAMHAQNLINQFGGMDLAIVERMVHYPDAGRKDSRQAQASKAEALLDLTAIGSYVAAKLARDIKYLTAAEWKGQAPEDVTTFRVVRALDPRELAILNEAKAKYPSGLHHNLIDCTGIGLKHLGRFSLGR